jgi:hypothetical protein
MPKNERNDLRLLIGVGFEINFTAPIKAENHQANKKPPVCPFCVLHASPNI